MEPLRSCLHLRGRGFIYHSEFPAAYGACSGAICLGCLAHGASNTNINPLINCTDMFHQHSISGRLIGWFNNFTTIHKQALFSELYSGRSWNKYELPAFPHKRQMVLPQEHVCSCRRAGLEVKCFAHYSVLVRAVPASPNISAALWSEKRWLAPLHLIRLLFSHLCKPPRRDAELSIQSGCWGLCFVAR